MKNNKQNETKTNKKLIMKYIGKAKDLKIGSMIVKD